MGLVMKIKIFILLIMPFVFISCIDELKEPVMPVWDVELNIPIAIKSYTIEDIVKNQEQIEIEQTHPNKILRFTTDKIEKDTTLNYLFDNTFNTEADTSLPVIGPAFSFDLILASDSVKIDSAKIQSGTVEYNIVNNNLFAVNVNIVFPGLTRNTATSVDTFKIVESVPANQSKRLTVSLNDYSYKQPPNQPPGTFGYGIWAKVFVSSSFIGLGQSLQLEMKVRELKYTSLAGRVKPFNLGVNRQVVKNELSGDLREFFKAVSFDSIVVTFQASNTIKGFDIALKNLQVIGRYKNATSPIYLLINNKNFLDTVLQPNSTTTFTFTNQNTNINQFINATPDSIELVSSLVFNSGYNSGVMNTADRILFSIKIDAYSKMKVENAYITDTLELDIEGSTKDQISKSNEAILKTEIENGVPFSVQFVGYFLDKDKNKLFYFTRQTTQNLPGDTLLNITGANVNSQGFVTSSSFSNISFNLNKSDFEKFKNAEYAVVRFRLSSTNNQSVVLSAQNKMKFKLIGKVNYKVEESK